MVFQPLTEENLSSSDSYGYELIFSGQVMKWLRLNSSLNVYQTVFNGDNIYGAGVGQTGYGWNGTISSFIKLNKDFNAQLSYNYTDPGVHSQGIISPRQAIQVACSKKILNKKGTISVRVSDVFNMTKFHFISEGPEYHHEGTFKWETQIAYLNFSYKFGNQKLKKEKRTKNDNQDKLRKTGDRM